MFDENFMECYAEWAEQELVWGKGMYNWTRTNHKRIDTETSEIDDNHPLCQFGYGR